MSHNQHNPDSKYGKWQDRGKEMQECISGASKTLLNSTTELKTNYQDLIDNGWKIEQGEQDVPVKFQGNVVPRDLSYQKAQTCQSLNISKRGKVKGQIMTACQWIGCIAPGVIFIEIIERKPKGTGQDIPQISDLTRIAYEHKWSLPSLEHVCVCSIEEESTKKLCRDQIYKGNGLTWIEYEDETAESTSHTWEYGTPEYQALLGTRIGRIVGFLVLNGFERGTRRIARIVTFHAKENDYDSGLSLFIGFDIEPTTNAIAD
ncbi:hypothetical protein N7466_007707 [Penicillium verhagenii]|uniref:uncharacterized protein n=1 Tax=Penicillium verhagenii TaxID=1562060 RepID=UPI0025454576|nr:uncharacterized protein N7466_007707 [Penicillium verhagenii]KAJ5928751.1 hypothetical protein N7466_007707 [Penicillium verhagenii]